MMPTTTGVQLNRWYNMGITDYDDLCWCLEFEHYVQAYVRAQRQQPGKTPGNVKVSDHTLGWNSSLIGGCLTNTRRYMEG